MSVVLERPEITPFLNIRQDKPPEQAATELASYSLETRRIPDPYRFLISQGGELLSPSAGCRIKDVVQRTHPAGELEYQALSIIEQWAAKSDRGAIAWVSPPYQNLYPSTKIIISEIEMQGQQKQLFNRAIILDLDEEKCLKFAQDLANYSQNRPLLTHLDAVRATPLILNTQKMPWINILQELIVDPDLWQMVTRGDDQRIKEETLALARTVYQRLDDHSLPVADTRMMLLGMLGDKLGSCPVAFTTGTAFQLFSSSSLLIGSSFESDQYGSLEFECPKCNRVNRRPKGHLIGNCQHCSVDVTC